jgi:hypothetical protein
MLSDAERIQKAERRVHDAYRRPGCNDTGDQSRNSSLRVVQPQNPLWAIAAGTIANIAIQHFGLPQ